MGKIVVIPNSDFSRNCIVKVDIMKQDEKSIDSQTQSSTVSDNNSTLKTGVAIDIEYILAWFGLNFAVEVIAFSLLVPPIVLALKKAKLAGVKPINKQEVLNDVEDVSTVNSEEK